MKAKDIPCSKCGSMGRLCGSDYTSEYGPFIIQCTGCGRETIAWALQREAWQQWKADNQTNQITR